MSDVIDLFDQAIFLGERATGVTDVVQCIWVYNRAVDVESLRRFHANLRGGKLSRLIERSPVPFGRHRWVASDTPNDIEFVPSARPRTEFDDWLTEQAHAPIDPEHGPGWHLAVVRFSDGGTGISLVTSHSLTDGAALQEALAAAAAGCCDDASGVARGSRPRWRAVCEDTWRTAREVPGISRAALATIRRVRNTGGRTANPAPAPAPAPVPATAGPDVPVTTPTAAIFVDAAEWDARAQSLGGTSNTLLVGLAARLAQRLGRVAADGSAELTMPVNERGDQDTRGNAVVHVSFAVDPEPVTRDLSEVRAAIKQALARRDEMPDERRALLPVIPLIPTWLFRRIVSAAAVSPIGVNSSNLGAVPPHLTRPDGTQADFYALTVCYAGVTRAIMQRIGGRLELHSGRADGRVFVTVLAYQPGAENTNNGLRQALSDALGDFALPFRSGWQ